MKVKTFAEQAYSIFEYTLEVVKEVLFFVGRVLRTGDTKLDHINMPDWEKERLYRDTIGYHRKK